MSRERSSHVLERRSGQCGGIGEPAANLRSRRIAAQAVKRDPHGGERLPDLVVQFAGDPTLEPAGILAQGGFVDPFALRDFAGDLRDADDLAVRIADGRDRQRDVNPPAVLGASYRFKMLDPLAATDPLQDRRFFVLPIEWQQHGDRATDDLLGLVAEDPLAPLFQ